MSERCHETLECRPEDLRCALAIHTQKIPDSCRDKDCIEDLRVYLTRESQTVLDAAAAAKVRSAELIYTTIDVSPVAFHRNHYAIDLTFYYKVIADAAVGPCRPAAVCGLALFSKRAVLCGENSGAHIFRSDCPGNVTGSLPTAVVEVTGTNSQVYITTHIKKIPHFSQEKWGISDCRRTWFFVNTEGATLGRPPKNIVFRISRREIALFFRLASTDFALQNLRATKGRPYDGLF